MPELILAHRDGRYSVIQTDTIARDPAGNILISPEFLDGLVARFNETESLCRQFENKLRKLNFIAKMTLEMRKYQREYFAFKTSSALSMSKKLEKQLDTQLDEYTRDGAPLKELQPGALAK